MPDTDDDDTGERILAITHVAQIAATLKAAGWRFVDRRDQYGRRLMTGPLSPKYPQRIIDAYELTITAAVDELEALEG